MIFCKQKILLELRLLRLLIPIYALTRISISLCFFVQPHTVFLAVRVCSKSVLFPGSIIMYWCYYSVDVDIDGQPP